MVTKMRLDLRIICVMATGAIACFNLPQPVFASAKHQNLHKQGTATTQSLALMLAKRDGSGKYTIDSNVRDIAFRIDDIIYWSGGTPSDIANLTISTQQAMLRHGLHDKCGDILLDVDCPMEGQHIGNKASLVFEEYAKLRIENVDPDLGTKTLSKFVKSLSDSLQK